MTDPKYAVGDRVRFNGQPAEVGYPMFWCSGDSDYRLDGYEIFIWDGPNLYTLRYVAEDRLTPEPKVGTP